MILTIPHSKGDQLGAGQQISIAIGDRADLCAVRAVEAWRTAAGIRIGRCSSGSAKAISSPQSAFPTAPSH